MTNDNRNRDRESNENNTRGTTGSQSQSTITGGQSGSTTTSGQSAGSSTTGGSNQDLTSTIRYNRNNRSFNIQGQTIQAREFLNQIGLTQNDLNEIFSR